MWGGIKINGVLVMKLSEVRIRNYRCIIDSGWFRIEDEKTILVGKNESGKTIILRALQHLNRDERRRKFDALKDYPRHLSLEENNRSEDIVSAKFKLEDRERDLLSDLFASIEIKEVNNIEFLINACLNNEQTWKITGVNYNIILEGVRSVNKEIEDLSLLYNETTIVSEEILENLGQIMKILSLEKVDSESENLTNVNLASFLEGVQKLTTFSNSFSEQQYSEDKTMAVSHQTQVEILLRAMKKIEKIVPTLEKYLSIGDKLFNSIPQFVFFDRYHEIDSEIHVDDLLEKRNRGESDESLGIGNLNLIKTLGFTLEELYDLGLDRKKKVNRKHRLERASRRLTDRINEIWQPEYNGSEACKLNISADGQTLRFEVSEESDIWIELNERSAGYKWLVSFYITVIAEVEKLYENTIFLLDEPALSLHASKQVKFRDTLSSLAKKNQTIFTTHSPFLVGQNELSMVRVVELKIKENGTNVHEELKDREPSSLFPLQVALGYNLASNLFFQQKNLVVEGYTDREYIQTTAEILKKAKKTKLDDTIRIVPADGASAVSLHVAVLFGNKLRVAVLLDSDNAGNIAARKDVLTKDMGVENILRVDQFLDKSLSVKKAEIEDMLRETLADIASKLYKKEGLVETVKGSPKSINIILKKELGKRFDKVELLDAYKIWADEGNAKLSPKEIKQWTKLIKKINHIMNDIEL